MFSFVYRDAEIRVYAGIRQAAYTTGLDIWLTKPRNREDFATALETGREA